MTVQRALAITSARLEPGEKLLWSGMPQQGLLLRSSDWFLIPFALFWAGGFAVFAVEGVAGAGAPVDPCCALLFSAPFVLVGGHLTVGRFALDSYLRSRTAYAVTNRRVLFVREGLGACVRSRPVGALFEISLRCRPNGVGSIVLDSVATGWGRHSVWGYGHPALLFGPALGSVLEGCPGAERIYRLLLSAREELRSCGTDPR